MISKVEKLFITKELRCQSIVNNDKLFMGKKPKLSEDPKLVGAFFVSRWSVYGRCVLPFEDLESDGIREV